MAKTWIRTATLDDIDAIAGLGIQALKKDPYPELKISPVKVYSLATECVSSENNFSYVAEKNGTIVGAVCAVVHPIMCYDKSQATVVQYYCTEPGEGIKLIRELMRWVESRPVVKMVCFTLEINSDPRIAKILNRLGLKGELPVYLKIM